MGRWHANVMVTLGMCMLLAGCTRVELPAWHQVAVFSDRGATSASMETPIDLTARRLDDARWVVESPVVQTASTPGFNEALVSWNIALEPGVAAAIDLSVTDGTEWSPRMRVGHVGDASKLDRSRRVIDEAHPDAGRIDVDYFKSDRTWRAAQVTITLVGESVQKAPGRVERLSVCLSNTRDRRTIRADRVTTPAHQITVNNAVPFRSQATDRPGLAGRLCSPTSLAMVLAFRGVDRPVSEVAARVWDPEFDLYGNWPRNVQGAYELGLPGFLARFNDWSAVSEHLMAGEPLIVSIRAPRGVLRNAPYHELDEGHLIVLRGLDGHGGVLVNDPAAGDATEGQRTYSATDLTRAWMELGDGTAYVLLRPQPKPMAEPGR